MRSLALAWICAYISVFVDGWGCKMDNEDGSTAPFSALAAEDADRICNEADDVLAVEMR